MTQQTVFYAWQSDRDSKLTRYFIRDAAEEAIKTLATHPTIEDAERLVLDHDTKGVGGMPDIVHTILDKIDACSIFLADLTFAGKSEPGTAQGNPKLLPNPNVMIELGWAMKSVSANRIISIMNTAFGPPEELPFDLRSRRHPIQYHLPSWDAADRAEVRKKLVGDLRDAMRLILESAPPVARIKEEIADVRAIARETIHRDVSSFHERVLGKQFHGFQASLGVLTLSLIPEKPLEPPLDFTDPQMRRVRLRPIYGNEQYPEIHARYCVLIERIAKDDPPFAVVELQRNGSVFAADGLLLSSAEIPTALEKKYGDKITGHIPSLAYEKDLIDTVFFYLQLLRAKNNQSAIHCNIGLFRIRGFIMGVSTSAFVLAREIRIFEEDKLCPDAVIFDGHSDVSSPAAIARVLRPAFDQIWLDFGYPGSLNFDKNGWNPEGR